MLVVISPSEDGKPATTTAAVVAQNQVVNASAPAAQNDNLEPALPTLTQKKKKDADKKGKKEGPKDLPPGWYADYDEALAAAKKSRRPLFVNFRCER
jgi:hypothetical protein